MAYLRKPDGQKRGKCDSTNPETPTKLKKPYHQMPASPVIPLEDGEDRASHDKHIKTLQQECKNNPPCKQVS